MDKLILQAIWLGIAEIAFILYMSYMIVQEANKK
jgi:hypothetical protein